jgi:hypothetical protein
MMPLLVQELIELKEAEGRVEIPDREYQNHFSDIPL